MSDIEAEIMKIWEIYAYAFFEDTTGGRLSGDQVQKIVLNEMLATVSTWPPLNDSAQLLFTWKRDWDAAKKAEIIAKLFPSDKTYLKEDYPKPSN